MAKGHPRRKYTKTCVWCHEPFHPFRAAQRCCSKPCGAQERDARLPTMRAARMRGLEALQARQRPKRVSAKLRQCKTLGEAYRLGFTDGYGCGWQRRNRGRIGPTMRFTDAPVGQRERAS